MIVHRFIDVGGARLHVAEEGSGPPVALLNAVLRRELGASRP